jgi:hypothetical protein
MNRALSRNREEGYEARYVGVEYRADRPAFLYEQYPNRIGQIRYASWSDVFIELEKKSVDFLFYDAVANDEELEKFFTYSDRFSDQEMIVSAWSSLPFFKVADRMDRDISVLNLQSKKHWSSGSNLSVIHKRRDQRARFQSGLG